MPGPPALPHSHRPGDPTPAAGRRGRFIVLDGGEASGKSTQAAELARRLDAVLTREPGGTIAGEHIRSLLLDPDLPGLDARTELLLLLAARAQHVAQVIGPALAAGRDVVCDRYAGSSIAYQGYGRGMDPAEVANLSTWAAGGLEPDLVVLLRVDAAAAGRRLGRRGGTDRMEAEGAAFFARVATGFAAQAAADPDRWRIVDGSGSIPEVAEAVAAVVAEAFGAARPALG